MSDLLGLLGRLESFREFTRDELVCLDRALVISEYPDGHRFTAQGNQASDLAIILAGQVEVTRLGPISGRLRRIQILERGALCGLLSMVDILAEETTCTARGPVLAASLSRAACSLLMHQSASIGFHFQLMIGSQLARDLAERNDAMYEQLAEL